MNEEKIILSFEQVELRQVPHGLPEMRGLDFRLMPGELARVRVEPGNEHLPLADAALGLIAPDAGRVLFSGMDWRKLRPERELAARARIGRVFEQGGWISNLNVLENITLSQRHHTIRPLAEIIAEARELARELGLSQMPEGRPAVTSPRDLRRAQWVRAFMGRPELIILERPTVGVAPVHAILLAQKMARALESGVAVLWIHDAGDGMDASLPQNCLRFFMQGDTMTPAKTTDP